MQTVGCSLHCGHIHLHVVQGWDFFLTTWMHFCDRTRNKAVKVMGITRARLIMQECRQLLAVCTVSLNRSFDQQLTYVLQGRDSFLLTSWRYGWHCMSRYLGIKEPAPFCDWTTKRLTRRFSRNGDRLYHKRVYFPCLYTNSSAVQISLEHVIRHQNVSVCS